MGDKTVSEGRVSISACSDVFYNPHMHLCRDISSLAFGALPGKLSICDGFCATGIRGIRYKKENTNAASITFVDLSEKAIKCAKKNAIANGICGKKSASAKTNVRTNKIAASKSANAGAGANDAAAGCKFVHAEICSYLRENPFDFVELDPFGSPAPYLHDAMHSLAYRKLSYLSVTATDMAVLCGAHHAACLKNYQSAPLDNEFCHENAVRILIGKVARAAADFALGITPIFSISHRHYVKIFFRVQKGAVEAVESIKSLGYVSWCPKCLSRTWARLPLVRKCPCSGIYVHAGPMWLGKLWDEKTVKKMIAQNKKRKYENELEIGKLLSLIAGELSLPLFYYDLHVVCKKQKVGAVAKSKVIATLQKAGFAAASTHFNSNAIKTDAKVEDIVKAIKGH